MYKSKTSKTAAKFGLPARTVESRVAAGKKAAAKRGYESLAAAGRKGAQARSHESRVEGGKKAAQTRGYESLANAGRKGGLAKKPSRTGSKKTA